MQSYTAIWRTRDRNFTAHRRKCGMFLARNQPLPLDNDSVIPDPEGSYRQLVSIVTYDKKMHAKPFSCLLRSAGASNIESK